MSGQLKIAGAVADGSITTAKLANDAVDGTKIADDAINSEHLVADSIDTEHYAAGSVDTTAIADDAVTEDKLANSINTAIAANTAKDLTALSASNLTSGTVPDARFPATLPAISGANLTGIASAGKAHNLVINGAMQVAQRATTNNTAGASSDYKTLDRFMVQIQSGTLTESQQDLSSSDTPYTLGFRKYMRILNQSGIGAGAAQYAEIDQRIEGQNIAQSGWNYTSSSSYITLSFWVRASVAQAYVAVLYSNDGTQRHYPFEIKDSGGSTLSANTWTKITKTISGDSGITINNDNGNGETLSFIAAYGTNYTSSSGNFDAWNTTGGGTDRWPDMTTTWATTTNATFDITGIQLEVGSTATDFEHRSFGEELALCKRYFEKVMVTSFDSKTNNNHTGGASTTFAVEKRAIPTCLRQSNFYEYNSGGQLTSHTATTYGFLATCTGGGNKSQQLLSSLFHCEAEL